MIACGVFGISVDTVRLWEGDDPSYKVFIEACCVKAARVR